MTKEKGLTSMALMMSLGPVMEGSNSKRPLEVARATDADLTPGFRVSVDSIRATQDAHVMPEICAKIQPVTLIII